MSLAPFARLAVPCAVVAALAFASPALAAWSVNGDSIAVWPCTQSAAAAVPDGAGGTYLVWSDQRDCTNARVFAQRLRANGTTAPGWPHDGLAVVASAIQPGSARGTTDGAGGLIVAWTDRRSGAGSVYVQHVSPDARLLWGANAVRACQASGLQHDIGIAPDQHGGVYLTWMDFRRGMKDAAPFNTPYYDLYAQRVDAAGAPQWGDSALGLDTRGGGVTGAPMATDGGDGVLIAYEDYFANSMLLQHVDAAGHLHLAPGGAPIEGGFSTAFVPDGAGGLIAAYSGGEYGKEDIFVQRIDSTGAASWTSPGRLLVSAPYRQLVASVLGDGQGGAYVAWDDSRYGADDVFLQRIGPDGARVTGWPLNGLPIATQTGDQFGAVLTPDGAGGCLLAWNDDRDLATSGFDVYVKRVMSDGYSFPGWEYGGVPLTRATGDQVGPILAPDGTGGAFVAWDDERSNVDVFANRVDGNGVVQGPAVIDTAGPPPPPPPPPGPPARPLTFAIAELGPNPVAGGPLTVGIVLTSTAPADLAVFDLRGRKVLEQEVEARRAGAQSAVLDVQRSLPPGVYVLKLTQSFLSATRKFTVAR